MLAWWFVFFSFLVSQEGSPRLGYDGLVLIFYVIIIFFCKSKRLPSFGLQQPRALLFFFSKSKRLPSFGIRLVRFFFPSRKDSHRFTMSNEGSLFDL